MYASSYETLVRNIEDAYIPLKLQFFQDIASHLQGFLTAFQSNDPMVPFIEKALVDIFQSLMKMIVKPDVLAKADTGLKLAKLDLSKAENLIATELIKLPTATKSLLSTSNLPNDHRKRDFKRSCKDMLVKMISKLQERSPLKYGIARYASALSPQVMVSKKERCVALFDKLVDRLYECSRVTSKEADMAKKEYFQFLQSANSDLKDEFLTFKPDKMRLDHFFRKLMDGDRYKSCWKVCKLVLTLSHGQAAVERGFSFNKEVLVENLEKKSLVSQRLVTDYIHHFDKPIWEIPLANDLLKSCRQAHSRYYEALESNRAEKATSEKDRKRKMKHNEIAGVEEKKRALESTIGTLTSDIETYSIQAEKEMKIKLLTKANAFRVKLVEKKKTLSDLESVLVRLREEVKNI